MLLYLVALPLQYYGYSTPANYGHRHKLLAKKTGSSFFLEVSVSKDTFLTVLTVQLSPDLQSKEVVVLLGKTSWA